MSKNQAPQTSQESQVNPRPETDILALLSEFSSPDFVDPNGRLPRIQAVRGEDLKQFGYFVPIGEMAKAGWGDFDESQFIDYTFSDGDTEKGILLQNPRMLVCPKTKLFGIDRKQTQDTQTTVIVGEYWQYKDDENVVCGQIYQIFLLDKNNQPLHQVPLSYKAKGANQASFSVKWQEFCAEFNTCFSLANQHLGISPKPKNNTFNSLLVFCPKVARELVGDKQKSPALRVVDYEHPTLENWTQFFVGIQPEVKKMVWDALAPHEPLTIPGVPTPAALSAGQETSQAALAAALDVMPF